MSKGMKVGKDGQLTASGVTPGLVRGCGEKARLQLGKHGLMPPSG